jgi:hypothetical protein
MALLTNTPAALMSLKILDGDSVFRERHARALCLESEDWPAEDHIAGFATEVSSQNDCYFC